MGPDVPPDGLQKLAALRGPGLAAPCFHGRSPFFPSSRRSGRSRGFLEDLVDAARYRLGAFSGHLVSKRRQLLALFAQHLELLVRMRRPEFDDIRWRLGCRDLWREIETRLDVSPSHIDHLEVKGTDV